MIRELRTQKKYRYGGREKVSAASTYGGTGSGGGSGKGSGGGSGYIWVQICKIIAITVIFIVVHSLFFSPAAPLETMSVLEILIHLLDAYTTSEVFKALRDVG